MTLLHAVSVIHAIREKLETVKITVVWNMTPCSLWNFTDDPE